MYIGPPSQTSSKDNHLINPINGFGNGTVNGTVNGIANGTANGISNGGIHGSMRD